MQKNNDQATGNEFNKLRELKKLMEDGIISEDEFNVKKKEFLKEI